MKPEELNLFYHPKDRLRMTVADRESYITVRPAWAAPLSHRDRYLSLLNAKGEEITLVADPNQLSPESLKTVREELSRRYLTARVIAIMDARSEFGATYWHVDTDRGPRDLVTQSLQENAQWLDEGHLLLIDVDGNRFEVKDVGNLDQRSREFIAQIL